MRFMQKHGCDVLFLFVLITYRKHSTRKRYHENDSALEALPVTSHTKQSITVHLSSDLFETVSPWGSCLVTAQWSPTKNPAEFTELRLPPDTHKILNWYREEICLLICMDWQLSFTSDQDRNELLVHWILTPFSQDHYIVSFSLGVTQWEWEHISLLITQRLLF